MTLAAPHDAIEQLAAVAANAMVVVHGAQALREGRVDNLALTDPIARLALTRALRAMLPGFPGLWLDLPAVDGPLAPPEPPEAAPLPAAQGDDLEAFLRAVLRAERSG